MFVESGDDENWCFFSFTNRGGGTTSCMKRSSTQSDLASSVAICEYDWWACQNGQFPKTFCILHMQIHVQIFRSQQSFLTALSRKSKVSGTFTCICLLCVHLVPTVLSTGSLKRYIGYRYLEYDYYGNRTSG